MADPFADLSDVAASMPRPLSDFETQNVPTLIERASARLRQKVPFDIDARIALHQTDPANPIGLDPVIVTDLVATIVKRYLVNPEGAVTTSEGVGPYSRSASFVNRYDKTGSDVRGAIEITDSDIDQLRPAVPTFTAGTIRTLPGNHPFPLGPAGPIDETAFQNKILQRLGFTEESLLSDGFDGGAVLVPVAADNDVPTIIAVTGNFTANAGDEVWVAVPSNTAVTGTLSPEPAGQHARIKRVDNGNGTLTIVAAGGALIDGQPSFQIAPLGANEFDSDGVNFAVF